VQYIDVQTRPEELTVYLQNKNWLNKNEVITAVTVPGAGNMNVVLRLQTNQRSLILKQSRPFVQKYQDLAAPLDRIDVEYQFYKAVSIEKDSPVRIPTVFHYDSEAHLMLLEDLGQCEDMTSIYTSQQITPASVKQLLHFLEQVHQTTASVDFPLNLELRKLNYQHIFSLPFIENNGFDLNSIQDGLQELAEVYQKDLALRQKVEHLGQQYLAKGSTLLHGDYYPGSWMQVENQLYVIDPEFSFVGEPEFDLGVMAAHLIIATQDITWVTFIQEHYTLPLQKQKLQELTGIEIMRRLIGLAQLPLPHSLIEKQHLLKIAYSFIMN
jgi:5-methylthioribose kinase